MKKRSLLIALITMVMIVMSTAAAFAAGSLELVSSYPEDGQKNTSIENVGVKLTFNNDVDSEEALKANESAVKIVDEEGNKLPLRLVAKGKTLLVVGDSTVEGYSVARNADYRLVIDAGFQDNEGNNLGEQQVISFRTFNQRLNSYINMGMMFVMFGGIMVMTIKQTADQNKEKKKEEEPKPKNPYREAKRTGKSVEEIVATESARKQKANKKLEKQQQKEQAMREKLIAKDKSLSPELPYVYKVKKPRPISSAKGTEEEKRQQSKTRQRATGKKK